MARSPGREKSASRRMVNRAPLQCTEQTRTGRSSAARRFTTRRKRTEENAQRPIRKALFPASNLLHQSFEARIAPKVVEQRISREEEEIAVVASGKGMLERR